MSDPTERDNQAAAAAFDPTTTLRASFDERSFVPAPDGTRVMIKLTSPAPVWYGPGFPAPNQPFLTHDPNNQHSGQPYNGVGLLTITPQGEVRLMDPNTWTGEWQYFFKQNGVVFCTPRGENDAAYGFVFKQK